jgi:glucosamine-6-phosphate deaminase
MKGAAIKMIRQFTAGELTVKVYATRREMGEASAAEVSRRMRAAIAEKGSVSILLAAAPSQNDFLAALAADESIDWSRVYCFHMDDYHTLPVGAPQRFDVWLEKKIINKVKPAQFFRMAPEPGMSVEQIAVRYAKLLAEHPLDISCIGIGENGHIAFNDPPVADFNDPAVIKEVTMDEVCRNQQVHDGAFPSIGDVPQTAITLTIPPIVAAGFVSAVVPTKLKAKAVANTVNAPINEAVPASILRRTPGAIMFVDADAASLL